MNFGLSRSKFLKARILEPNRILVGIRESLAFQGHLRATFFWGIAFRQVADALDRCVMAHLSLLMAHLGAEFKTGNRLTLLLGDTHARANKISEETISAYGQSIQMLAGEFRFQTELLSRVHPLELNDGPNPSELEVFTAHRHQLLSDAAKLGFTADASNSALRYFLARWRERVPIAKKAAPSILLSAENPAQAFLLPDLPTLFIYTLPGRKVCKPWLIKNDSQESRNEIAIEFSANQSASKGLLTSM